jgi:hypothetical protein
MTIVIISLDDTLYDRILSLIFGFEFSENFDRKFSRFSETVLS